MELNLRRLEIFIIFFTLMLIFTGLSACQNMDKSAARRIFTILNGLNNCYEEF